MRHNTLQPGALALLGLLLGGCALQPKPDNLLPTSRPEPDASATLVTGGGFCVTLTDQGTLLTQTCDRGARQRFEWDAGALQLAQRCLVAKGEDGLAVTDCREESHQWQWQADRLFNRTVSLCLDVAGRRHQPGTPLRLAECYGGANQSFEWTPTASLLERLTQPVLTW